MKSSARRRSASVLALSVILLAQTAGAEEPQFERPWWKLWENNADALRNSWKSVDESIENKNRDLDKNITDYKSRLNKAEALRVQKEQEYERVRTAQVSLDQNERTIRKKIEELRRKAIDPDLSLEDQGQVKREIQTQNELLTQQEGNLFKLSDQARITRMDLQKATDLAEKTKEDVIKSAQKMDITLDPNADLQTQVNSLVEQSKANLKVQGVKAITEQFFDNLKEDYNKSGILFSDLEHLKTKLESDDQKLQAMKDSLEDRLNKTLIGQYVQQQITKAFAWYCTNPSFKAACEKGQTPEGLQNMMNLLVPSETRRAEAVQSSNDFSSTKSPSNTVSARSQSKATSNAAPAR